MRSPWEGVEPKGAGANANDATIGFQQSINDDAVSRNAVRGFSVPVRHPVP
jgi:hypothetical protein